MYVRRIALVAASLAIATGLAACGSGGSAPGAAGGQSTSSLDALPASQLLSMANKEGSVSWYTTFSSDDVAPFIAAFNKAYPKIKVDALRLSADKIPPRVITEQRGGKYNADVISGDSPQVAQLLQVGALQPYTPPSIAALPSGLSLPKGYEGVVYAVTTSIAYNPTVLKQKHLTPPTSWADLAKPEYKSAFSIDPSAVNWYDSLVHSYGSTKAASILKGLGANDPRLVESHTDALTDVQAGEPAIAATGYGYKASSLAKKTPSQVAFVNPNPLPASLTLIDLAKSAPHPAAARVFENWIVSKAGQQAVVDVTNHTSIRPDVQNDPKVWDPSKWKPAWGEPNLPAATYNKELAALKSALNAP